MFAKSSSSTLTRCEFIRIKFVQPAPTQEDNSLTTGTASGSAALILPGAKLNAFYAVRRKKLQGCNL